MCGVSFFTNFEQVHLIFYFLNALEQRKAGGKQEHVPFSHSYQKHYNGPGFRKETHSEKAVITTSLLSLNNMPYQVSRKFLIDSLQHPSLPPQ